MIVLLINKKRRLFYKLYVILLLINKKRRSPVRFLSVFYTEFIGLFYKNLNSAFSCSFRFAFSFDTWFFINLTSFDFRKYSCFLDFLFESFKSAFDAFVFTDSYFRHSFFTTFCLVYVAYAVILTRIYFKYNPFYLFL